jgi:prepilin-type N-terminal cleavage/methylation domain-containing protein/prepilin-type processing-associated H-X9-DG protein
MQRKGFTLIEMLVVIGIIALLLGVLLPSLMGAREAGRRSACLGSLHSIGVASLAYQTGNRFPPFFDDEITIRNANYSYSWSDFLVKSRCLAADVPLHKIPNRDGTEGIAGVYLAGMISQRATVFQCPQQSERIWAEVEGVAVSYRADYVATGHENDATLGAAWPTGGIYGHPPRHFQDGGLIWLGEAFTTRGGISTREYVRETQLHVDPNDHNPLRHRGGSTYLFGDGHAVWSKVFHTADYTAGLGYPWEATK